MNETEVVFVGSKYMFMYMETDIEMFLKFAHTIINKHVEQYLHYTQLISNVWKTPNEY